MVGKDSFCRQVSADGYETSVFTEDLDGAFLCFAMIDENGKKIALVNKKKASLCFSLFPSSFQCVQPRDHGGIRLVCPSLFGWKSAKFLVEMEFRQIIVLAFGKNLLVIHVVEFHLMSAGQKGMEARFGHF